MTQENYICLTSMGHYHPETLLSNAFFEGLDLDTSSDWIEERTGIVQRRSVMSQQEIRDIRHGKTNFEELKKAGRIISLPDFCKPAWQLLVERTGKSHEELSSTIDLVLAGTSTPDWDLPANACAIAGELGINTRSFDVNSACSAFIVNLMVARSFMLTGQSKKIAIFNPERITTRTNYSDRSSCILFGDAASAALLELSDVPKGLVLVDAVMHSGPESYFQVQTPAAGLFNQNGKAVQKFAIVRTVEVTREILERNGLSTSDLSYFISHQANLRMLTSACEKIGLSEDQHLYNVHEFGNQACTGAPATLSQNWDKVRKGKYLVVSVVGAGLTWASALFKVYP